MDRTDSGKFGKGLAIFKEGFGSRYSVNRSYKKQLVCIGNNIYSYS